MILKRKEGRFSDYDTIIFLALITLLVITTIIYKNIEEDKEYIPTNHYGLAIMGLAPTAVSRPLTDRDIITEVVLEYQGVQYALIESRTLEAGDYGKTFFRRIN